MQAAVGGDRLLHQGINNLGLTGQLEGKRGVPTWGNHRGRAELAMSGDVHLNCRASKAAGDQYWREDTDCEHLESQDGESAPTLQNGWPGQNSAHRYDLCALWNL